MLPKPKIKPEILDNNFYAIRSTNSDVTNVMFVDFQYQSSTSTTSTILTNPFAPTSASSYPTTIGPNIFQKTIKVQPLTLFVKDLSLENIRNEINKEFFKVATDLGKKNREESQMRFDINVNEIRKKGIAVDRGIIAKFNNVSNYIATQGRIGPSQYLVSNSKTYAYILKYINNHNNIVFNPDGNLMIGNMPYVIDNNIEDDIILLGRKNSMEQPGVHCIILTDNDGHIHFNETYDPQMINNKVTLYYTMIDLGFHPQYHFFVINTRDIAYYRNLKLKRIKELYGN